MKEKSEDLTHISRAERTMKGLSVMVENRDQKIARLENAIRNLVSNSWEGSHSLECCVDARDLQAALDLVAGGNR